MRNAGANGVESKQPNMQFQINRMGNMKDCNFYIPDATGDNTALAFRAAFSGCGGNENKLCAHVGSMLCAVVPTFKNSVEAALNGSGIRPRFVSLPSQAQAHSIVDSKLDQLDWSSILSVFGYCILVIFKIDRGDFGLVELANASEDLPDDIFEEMCEARSPNERRLYELQTKVGCNPNTSLYPIPFNQQKENIIRTMLGTRPFRTSVINFLVSNSDNSDSQISSLCQYLINILSWSGDMRVYTLINDKLVKTKSPVLADSRVIAEVENFEVLKKAVKSHTYPQFFNHMCSTLELLYLDVSRFPTLYTVARLLENGNNDVNEYEVSSGANRKTVLWLLKLHRTALEQN